MVITRFAPSPTGNLHIGGARTALFNFLYAKNCGGKFFLRIEDTDKKRSNSVYLDSIFNSLDWLGFKPDKIVYQSKNQARHKEVADKLLNAGAAYKKEGAVRLAINKDKDFFFDDLILGKISVSGQEVEDVVLLRSDGSPTYTLAVVVDDYDMGITNVIRGADHITNTFRQIAVYNALDWAVPKFAHIPLINNMQGAKLSKRDGACDVIEFKKLGILKEALFNYLLRLGWSCGNKEIFSSKEAAELFNLSSVGKSAAKFDTEKLLSLNQHYLKSLPCKDVAQRLLDFCQDYKNLDPDVLFSMTDIFRQGAKSLKDLAESLQFCISYIKPESEVDLEITAKLRQMLKDTEWGQDLKEQIKLFCKETKISAKDFYTNLRLAILGKKSSPAILDVIKALGKDATVEKLNFLLKDAK